MKGSSPLPPLLLVAVVFLSVDFAEASRRSWTRNVNVNTNRNVPPRTNHERHRRGGWWNLILPSQQQQQQKQQQQGDDHGTTRKGYSSLLLQQRQQQRSLRRLSRGGADSASASAAYTTVDNPGSKTIHEILEEWLFRQKGSDGSSVFPTLKANELLAKGLTDQEATALRSVFGSNSIEEPPPPSWFALIAEQFEDKLVRILVGVALLSALLEVTSGSDVAAAAASHSLWHRFAEPLVIAVLLLVNASVGVWQSKSAGNSIEALKAMQPSVCTVLRRRMVDVDTDDATATSASKTKTKTKNDSTATTKKTTKEIADFPANDLVPGDLIVLKVGDKVPADCRIFKYYNGRRSLTVDETCLTGESLAVEKLIGDEGLAPPNTPVQAQTGMVFAGTTVVGGGALCLVVATGTATEFGSIQAGVFEAKQDSHDQKTPLARQLDDFGNQLTILIGGVCALVWLASIPKMIAKDSTIFATTFEGMVYYAKVAVALGVAAIPEGLPAVITLCLSLGTRRMAQRNVIVRNLPSVETLGCVSVICSDKTGTLTTNEMTVISLVLLEKQKNNQQHHTTEHTVEGVSYSPIGTIEGISADDGRKIDRSSSLFDVAAVAALCNDAIIVGHDKDDGDDTTKHTRDFERTGEPTEAALCVLAEKLGAVLRSRGGKNKKEDDDTPPSCNSEVASYHVDRWRDEHPKSATLEFHRDRKSMSVLADFGKNTIDKDNDNNKAKNKLLVKGAANMVLDRCTHAKYKDGSVVKITGSLRRELEAKITSMATRPLRCLALAIKDESNLPNSLKNFKPSDDNEIRKHPLLKDPFGYENIESGLTLVGLVGIKDPARPEVADSIRKCTEAGIRVIMITGDARDTAVAIAKEINILSDDDDDNEKTPIKAFEGQEFFLKPIEEQREILSKDNIVFCRAQPSDKQALIKMLQDDLGEIPAMTGDGVNDAPALQQAAIGIAMGTGTAVSKEAADMVLADDDFSTIVSAVEEGRTIYANMQAFICFLISCNIGEICAIFFATLLGFPEPLTAMHLLWVNLVTDGPPATALGFNPPSPNSMKESPRPSDEPIMTKWLLTRYLLTGLYVGVATIGVFAQHYLRMGISLKQLSKWPSCGKSWMPPPVSIFTTTSSLCSSLFRDDPGRTLPQTLSLTTLVCMEMFKALSAVSVNDSILIVPPWKNQWLLLGVGAPFLLHLAVLYSSSLGAPGFGRAFGMVPLTKDHWKTVLMWSTPILLVDEVLKFIGRRVQATEKSKSAVDNIESSSESLPSVPVSPLTTIEPTAT